jgi:glycosyltransferase involved in cell wall biosynthesis
VLQVSTADQGGGASLSARNLHRVLRAQGFDAWLAVGSKLTDDPRVLVIPNDRSRRLWVRAWRRLQLEARHGSLLHQLCGAVAWLGEPKRFLDVRVRGREDFAFPGSRRILRLPPREPDIVHCHNLHGWYFDLRVLPWLTRTVPTILDLRDEWLLTGHCAYPVDCDRWLVGCGECPDLSVYPAVVRDDTASNWRRKRAILDRSRLYLSAPSRWLLDRAVRVIPNARIARVIPNAVETETFRPGSREEARRRRALPTSVPVVLTSAQNSFKDLDTTLSAIAHVDAAAFGAGGQGCERPQLVVLGRNQVDRSIGDWEVRFPGFIADREVVADYFRAADVFVHTATAEAFGKTVAEAMACGTATVATRVGGIPEVLADGLNGVLVEPRAPRMLAHVLNDLLRDPKLRERIGRHAAEAARTKYSLKRQADEFAALYREVIDDWNRRNRAD